MGWGTTFNTDIYISRESIEDIYTLDGNIEEVDNDIRHIREKILMYCAAGVNGVNKTDCEGNPVNPIDSLHIELKELLDWYEESMTKKTKYVLMRGDYDEKEGKFKTAWVG